MSIKSLPPKATVVINGQTWAQTTDTTVVVPPGSYNVVVVSDQLKNCPSRRVNVSAGLQTEVICSEAGWVKDK